MNEIYWLTGIIVLLLFALISTNFMMFRYRRQIREVCRQLSFHNAQRTNKEIRIDVRAKEIQDLQNQLNQMFEQCNALEAKYRNSEESLKDVITNISHDIRTPLTSINGYFQLLCDSKDEEEREKYARIITGRIESMSMLLEQLFTYVRVLNGGLTVNEKCLDVKQSLCDNLFSFYEDFKQKDIEPEVELPEETGYAMLDSALFTRILQNVMKNALVHGDISIQVRLAFDESKCVIEIKNHTKEVHSNDPEQVFERFYQADQSRNKQSSGLGLCIAKELTLKMGGSIHAYYQEEFFGIMITFSRVENTKAVRSDYEENSCN